MKKKDQYDPAFLSVQDKIHEAKEKTDSKASKAMVNIIGDLGSIPNVTPQGKDAANAGFSAQKLQGKKLQKINKDTYKKYKDNAGSGNFSSVKDQQNLMEAELEPLDLEEDILDDFTCLFIGRRRSGKTFAARWIMYNVRERFPVGVVITGTKLNKFWAKHVPDEFIHEVENMNPLLDAIFQRQKFLKSHPELKIDPRMFVILDDVLGDKFKTRFSKQLTKLFIEGRHYDLFCIITTQDPRGIPPDLRENCDLTMIFRQYQHGRQEAVANDFIDYIKDKDQRLEFLWNHTAMVGPNGEKIDEEMADNMGDKAVPQMLCVMQSRVTSNTNKIFKKLVARDPGDFILGDALYWEAMATGDYKKLKK